VSDQWVRIVWFGMLLLHGLGHGGAIGALAWIAARPGTSTGAWTAARSWLLPSLAPGTASLVATAFWGVSLAGFVTAAILFWVGNAAWEPVAVVSAVVSATGIVLFFGTWPMFNTLAALAVNVVVLVAALVVRWTPPAA
jgi:hypothetical protein